MELQWPLIVFTTLVAWSAGLFGTQALMAAFGVGKKAQVPAWIASAVLLAVGGIAVFFHLEHWERIFNGFGHLTSGITQELIAIVVLAAVAVAYLVMLRKSDDGASVPKWLAWLSVALSVALVAVMAHSYTMAARPAWDSVLWILYVLGNACVLGPATFAFLMAAAPPAGQPAGRAADAGAPAGLAALVGAAANALAALAFAIFLQLSAGSFADGQKDGARDPGRDLRLLPDAERGHQRLRPEQPRAPRHQRGEHDQRPLELHYSPPPCHSWSRRI